MPQREAGLEAEGVELSHVTLHGYGDLARRQCPRHRLGRCLEVGLRNARHRPLTQVAQPTDAGVRSPEGGSP